MGSRQYRQKIPCSLSAGTVRWLMGQIVKPGSPGYLKIEMDQKQILDPGHHL